MYALDGECRYVVLEGELEGDRFPPLSDLDPAAFVEECEIYEQYGVRPDNGKRLNRVLVPPHHAERFPRLGRREGRRLASDYEPHVVSGEAFEFPFGPVRVVGWESLYMGLVTTGEEVLDLYLFHWHKHRGIERRLTGLDPDRATFFVERADGLSSVGDTLAFCRAVEMATGTEVPPAAAHSRAVALELERIYNHAAAIAALCQSTGLSVGQARSEIVLEQLLRLNLAAFGHRYLFGVVRPGGVRREPDADQIRVVLPPVLDEFRYVVNALLVTNSHVDRLEATGIVTRGGRAPALAGRPGRARVGPGDRCPPRPPDRSGRRARTGRPHAGGGRRARPHARDGGRGGGVGQADRRPPRRSRPGSRTGRGRRRGRPGMGRVAARRGARLGVARAATAASSGRGCAQRRSATGGPSTTPRGPQNVFTDIPIIEASFWLTVAGFAR